MSAVKSHGSTVELPLKPSCLRTGGESGTLGVAVKCVDIKRNAVAKATLWTVPDTEVRKLGEQTGLDTLVVLAVNDGHWVGVDCCLPCRSKCIKCPAWGVWSQG